MTRLTVDPEFEAKLSSLDGVAEVYDRAGRRLGYFLPPGSLKYFSPISDEEMEQRRKRRTGRPLAAILQDLENQR